MHFCSCRILVFSHQEEVKIAGSWEKNISEPEEDKSELQAKLHTLWSAFKYTLNPDTVNTWKGCLGPVGQNSSSSCRNICTYPHRGN